MANALVIDRSIYSDDRFLKLVVKMGGKYQAIGALVTAWTLAQDWHLVSPHRAIPLAEWSKVEAKDLILEVGLARQTEYGIYVCGSNDQFEWLRRSEKAGKASAAKRLKKSFNQGSTQVDQGSTFFLPSTFPSSLSSSQLPISNFQKTKKKTKSTDGASAPVRPEGVTVPTWEAYREAYLARYGEPPVRNATVSGQLAQFVRRLGAEEAPLVAAFYLTHNDSFYLRTMHAIGPLLRDAEKLRTEWATGRRMLGTTARDVERMQHNSDVFAEAMERINQREAMNEK